MDLNEANARLKAAKMGVSIHARGKGSKLSLRAVLPPKNGNGKPTQQFIPFVAYATPVGLRKAVARAKELSADIEMEKFEWASWLAPKAADHDTVGAWVDRFEADYFDRRARNPKSETTWASEYQLPYNQLPKDAPLTAAVLLISIKQTAPDTRARLRRCTAYSALAKFAGLTLDVKGLRGNYSPKRVSPRDLPSDKVISEWHDRIHEKNEAWGWAFGVMACYGLRNHELFHIDLERLSTNPVLTLTDDNNGGGKTGARRVWACYPEWWDKWQLWDVKLPNVNGPCNKVLGARVTNGLKRYGFRLPYNLRHCWAVRTIEFGIAPELAAIQMGHSFKVHCETYHAWISDDVHQRAYDAAMQRPDRPLAP